MKIVNLFGVLFCAALMVSCSMASAVPDETLEPNPEAATEPNPEAATEPNPDPATEPNPDPETEPDPDPETEPEQASDPVAPSDGGGGSTPRNRPDVSIGLDAHLGVFGGTLLVPSESVQSGGDSSVHTALRTASRVYRNGVEVRHSIVSPNSSAITRPYDERKYPYSVFEGGTLRFELDFGNISIEPTSGSCTLTWKFSFQSNTSSVSLEYPDFQYTIEVASTTNSNEYVYINLTDCVFPEWDEAGLSYEIANSEPIEVLILDVDEDGDAVADPDVEVPFFYISISISEEVLAGVREGEAIPYTIHYDPATPPCPSNGRCGHSATGESEFATGVDFTDSSPHSDMSQDPENRRQSSMCRKGSDELRPPYHGGCRTTRHRIFQRTHPMTSWEASFAIPITEEVESDRTITVSAKYMRRWYYVYPIGGGGDWWYPVEAFVVNEGNIEVPVIDQTVEITPGEQG